MTLPRMDALLNYWQQSPPSHLLLAAYIGYKPKSKKPKKMTGNDIGELMQIFKSDGGSKKHGNR